MNATLLEPYPWKRVLEIEVPVEEFDQALNRRLAWYQKKIALPGFRRGKVPLEIIRRRFGSEIRGETIEELIQSSYEAACREKGVNPVSRGVVKTLCAEEGKPLRFTIETEVEPAIEIKGYQKLKIRPSPNKIRSSDVDEVVRSLLERNATFSDADRPVRKGDFVTFQYERVAIDGVERTDISSPPYPVEAGTSEIKGFDKAIIGSRAGETVEAEVTFPRDYPDKEIAGKKGVLRLKILKVQERHVPELTPEILKKLGDFRDEAHLRETIANDLKERENARARAEAASKAIEALIKANPFELPPSLVERYIDAVYEEYRQRTREGEQLPTREEIAARYRDYGIHYMKRQRILDYIATRENITATAEEVDREIEAIAQRYGQPADKLKEAFRNNGMLTRIREDIRERKTLDYLIGEYDPAAERTATAVPSASDSAVEQSS